MGFFNYIDLLDEFFPSLFFEKKTITEKFKYFFSTQKKMKDIGFLSLPSLWSSILLLRSSADLDWQTL